MNQTWLLLLVGLFVLGNFAWSKEPEFPTVNDLPAQSSLPDPLVGMDGRKIGSQGEWMEKRRPELKKLFQHYMYGYLPPVPEKIEFAITNTNDKFLDGKATKKEVVIRYSPAGTPPIYLTVIIPNGKAKPAPVVVGMNFGGNHLMHADPTIPLPRVWVPERYPGVVNNAATDAGRGKQAEVWNIDLLVDRGYALAALYCGDLDPDKPDLTDGLHASLLKPGEKTFGPHDPGSIAVWAWGFHRAVDYCVQDRDLDRGRIIAVGHSRLGKTALLAGAFDERIAATVPLQAGCGGTAPSRGKVGESVKQINDRFPHWFCDEFTKFNEQTEKIPFDQHCLIALCAPRPVLLPNAEEDQWANPDGQFEVLLAAEPVYKLLGVEGCASRVRPQPGELVNSRLGYYYRRGKHAMTRDDWTAILDFTDKQLGKP